MLALLRPSRIRMQTISSSPKSQSRTANFSHSTRTEASMTLPRLPVPNLHQTLQSYLKSVEPFILEDASRGGPSYEASYNLRARWAEDFERGIGKTCQERLLALDRASPSNWLDDSLWMQKAYHEWRAPLLINSNWWLAFHNDPNVPEEVILGKTSAGKAGITEWQVRRAAWLVHRILEWKERVSNQELHPETTRAGIWLHDTTAKMFNLSRIPQPRCDSLSELPSSTEPASRQLVVLLHDFFYVVDVLQPDMQIVTLKEIARRLRAVVHDVERRLESGQRAVPIGVLSADDRDRWTKNLGHLLSLSPKNYSIRRIINHSLFSLSLDHYTYVLPSTTSQTDEGPLPPPNTPAELTAHLHNVRSGPASRPAHNRWWDKPISLIVESNTRAGMLGEHSPCDALVPSIVAEYAVVQALDADAFDEPHPVQGRSQEGWGRLEWVTDERIERECENATRRARTIVEDSDDSVLWFDTYGAEWIKSSARLSPDAYVQMALQLAWYRSRGSFTATYETALTRLFKNGRTETIRTLTADSRAFVLAMVDSNVDDKTKCALLRRAVQTHTNNTRQAATGRGIDRHLLGLQSMLRPADGERHELFEDELFMRSQTWKLSTSGLSAGHQFRGTGFGSPYSDGYGINYLAGHDIIKFGVESKHSCHHTSTEGFKDAIMHALLDMRHIYLSNPLSLAQSRM